ncbi:hypothetical protein EJ110_NYTH21981 [Nymphaea thermarum]|nr:hypothetical protein EJ110_NYTH21981 [Nymphaea thermarum]
MEAQGGCYPKILLGGFRRGPVSASHILVIRTIRPLFTPDICGLHLQPRRLSVVKPLRSSSPPAPPPDGKEVLSCNSDTSEATVHVRFVLQKECPFGQQFLLTGEDPIFGSWEPSAAIAMAWSEGHIWTTEQDIPIESKPQFKFILKDASGALEWQPGPDRLMKLWKTERTITIEEDWESPELQKATEEPCENLVDDENPDDEILAEEEAKSRVVAEEGVKSSGLDEKHESVGDDFVEKAEGAVLVPGLTSSSIIDLSEELSG